MDFFHQKLFYTVPEAFPGIPGTVPGPILGFLGNFRIFSKLVYGEKSGDNHEKCIPRHSQVLPDHVPGHPGRFPGKNRVSAFLKHWISKAL